MSLLSKSTAFQAYKPVTVHSTCRITDAASAHLVDTRRLYHRFDEKRGNSNLARYGETETALAAGSGNAILDTISAVGSPLQSIGVLAFVVLFHEAGHFLAARSFNINVEEFSVGVGPKLLGFTPSKGQNEGIEFNLRAIPLGGYVRFPENYNQTLVQGLEEEAYEARQKVREMKKNAGKGKDEQSMGDTSKQQSPAVALFTNLFRNKKKEAEMAKTVEIAKPKSFFAGLLGKKTKKSMPPPQPIEVKDIEIEYYDDPNLLQNRDWFQRSVVLSAGVIFNLILAFSIYFGEATVGTGLPKATFDSGCLVSLAPRPESASYNILKQGDVILGINGKRQSEGLS
jgi:membrane-associated protease RseP (regulator of RpoE activity)